MKNLMIIYRLVLVSFCLLIFSASVAGQNGSIKDISNDPELKTLITTEKKTGDIIKEVVKVAQKENVKQKEIVIQEETKTVYSLSVERKIEAKKDTFELECKGNCNEFLNALFVIEGDSLKYLIGKYDENIMLHNKADSIMSVLNYNGKTYYQYMDSAHTIISMEIKETKVEVTKLILNFDDYKTVKVDTMGEVLCNKRVTIYRPKSNQRLFFNKKYISEKSIDTVEIKEVRTSIRDGNFIETFVLLANGDEYYSPNIISLKDYVYLSRPLGCYKIKDNGCFVDERSRNFRDFIRFNDVINYKRYSYGLYRPDDTTNLVLKPLSKNELETKYFVKKKSDFRDILQFSLYSDILGIINQENNPLLTLELSAYQRPNNRSFRSSQWLPLHFVRERISFKRFGGLLERDYSMPFKRDLSNRVILDTFIGENYFNADKDTIARDTLVAQAITLDRALLYQNSFFRFDVTAGLLEYLIYTRHLKTPHRFYFDVFGEIGLVRVKREGDTLNRPDALLLQSTGIATGAWLQFSQHFSMRTNFKVFKQRVYRTKNVSYPNNLQLEKELDLTNNWFTKLELKLAYKAPDKRNHIFFRTSVVNNHYIFKTKEEASKKFGTLFFEAQIGYTRDISNLFNTKIKDF